MSWNPADVCSRLSDHCISLCPNTDEVNGNVQQNLESQLHQIRSLVGEMRSKFRDVDALMKVGSATAADRNHDQQLAEVSKMILVMKTDLDRVVDQLHAATASQQSLQAQLDLIRTDRDALLEELRRSAIALQSNRGDDMQCVSGDVQDMTTAVNDIDSGLQMASSLSSTVFAVSPVAAATLSVPRYSLAASAAGNGVSGNAAAEANAVETVESEMMIEACEQSPSSSSLTAVANKSLDMSRSLTEKIAADADSDDDDDDDDNVHNHDAHSVPPSASSDSQNLGTHQLTTDKNLADIHCSLPATERSSKEVLRSGAMREIVETERTYCSCLWTLIHHFALSLRQSDIISSQEVDTMFPPCLVNIYESHCTFLHRLECRLASQHPCFLGDIFDTFIPSSDNALMQLYEDYVGIFPNCLVTLRKTSRQNTGFRKIIKGLELHPSCTGLPVSAFMLTPVQRMPRYVLLLKQLQQCTEPSYADFASIGRCLSRLGEFLSRLNNSMECSMAAVSAALVSTPPSPKPRRRFQFSFRSSVLDTSDATLQPPAVRDPLRRPQLHPVTTDMLVRRRHIVPSTSTPVGASRLQPVLALNRGATFSGYDCQLRSTAAAHANVAGVVAGNRKHHHHGTAENCSVIQFSPNRQQCSTPAGRDRCVPMAIPSSFLVPRVLTADASFCNKSNCSARVSRHASVSGVDDRPRKPDKLSSSFLSGGGGLGFLRRLSRSSARGSGSSPNQSCVADVSTTSVRRRSSFRDSFKRIFRSRRKDESRGKNVDMDTTICSVPASAHVKPLRPVNY